MKAGKVKEIADMRDETDLSGLKLAIDLKRGVDPDKLMAEAVPADAPAGHGELQLQYSHRRHAHASWAWASILEEWTAWRTDCVKRRVYFDPAIRKRKSCTCCRV